MGMVRVCNDNVHPYREQFRDHEIFIKPKNFILMEAGDALLFKGSFAPIKVDADGQPIPEGFKMIRIEEIPGGVEEVQVTEAKHICQACRYEGSSEKDLMEHINSNHKDQVIVDEEAEAALKKRGPGRPPKSAA